MRLLWQFGHVGSFQCKRTSLFNADKRLIVYWRLTTIGIRPRSSIRFVADQPRIARGSLSNVVVARTVKNLSAENKTDLAAALNPVSSVRRFARALWLMSRWQEGAAPRWALAEARPANSLHR